MKSLIASAFLMTAGLLSGCACARGGLVLAPVGPASFQPATESSNGTLVVFSAYDPNADFNSLPSRLRYTDYKVFSAEGRLLQSVQNDNGTGLGGAREVSLPAGSYRVVARANAYGKVTVPVVIVARQTTTVHLEGGGAWGTGAPVAQGNPVCLPDGRIVGWRAGLQYDSQAASESAPPQNQASRTASGLKP
jgi:hypothetical protein